jgi:hypothetical protein
MRFLRLKIFRSALIITVGHFQFDRKYLQHKVQHRCQRHLWQMGSYFDCTILGSSIHCRYLYFTKFCNLKCRQSVVFVATGVIAIKVNLRKNVTSGIVDRELSKNRNGDNRKIRGPGEDDS